MPIFPAKPMTRPELVGWIVLVLPPLFWAGNFVAGRAVRDDVPPMTLAFARHFVALVVLLPFGWAAMRRDIARYWACRWKLLQTSLAGMVAFNLLVYLGLHSATASTAQLLNSTIPVLIATLSAVLFKQRLGVAQMFGLVLSCGGVLTMILHGELARLLAFRFSPGDLLVFAGMVSFALFSILLRSLPADIDRLGLLGAQLMIAVVVLFPPVVWEHVRGARVNWTTGALAAMLYVGIAASLLANLLYIFGIARVGPIRAGMFIHLVPLYGAILSAVLLGESLQIYHAVGMGAVVAGLTCFNIAEPQTRRATSPVTS
ncbi:DMT family transporter [Bradyrhizobium sp. STM 3843]|uniref:DMT family transporter n=1 Tax=Bradyrhizobium sp. STM 3843 TaxID=551947 RepID=UPI0002ECC2CE|nr:DMT family transporter [Bradyrhizobium sp. STM 3843]